MSSKKTTSTVGLEQRRERKKTKKGERKLQQEQKNGHASCDLKLGKSQLDERWRTLRYKGEWHCIAWMEIKVRDLHRVGIISYK